MYSRDMSKLTKIYWGEGSVLPKSKLETLIVLSKDLINRATHKKKKNSKDGSGSSKRRKEI